MPKTSAGLLLYRYPQGQLQVLLGHMGGPFWEHKDLGGWTIPKGEYIVPESPFEAAKREFSEEIGMQAPEGKYFDLGEVKQKSGKIVHIWALEANFDVSTIQSNLFEMEWPKGSGKREFFPELDRAAWISYGDAQHKLIASQVEFLHRLHRVLAR